MKIIKTDGRYKNNRLGFTHIAAFRWGNSDDTTMYMSLVKTLEDMYGTINVHYTDDHGYPRTKRNDNYRIEVNKSSKRRRIYVKDETVFTMALLRC